MLLICLAAVFMGTGCKDKPPAVITTGYDTTLYSVIKAKQHAQIVRLEHELDSLKAIEARPNTKYVYLTKFVAQDSTHQYQLDLMSGLLTLHSLRDTVVDTVGTILQRGNKRLIDYLQARDAVELKENINQLQAAIIRSLKEQLSVDSADRRQCLAALDKKTNENLDLGMQLEAAREDNKALTKKRNGWRLATLVLLTKDGVRLLLRI